MAMLKLALILALNNPYAFAEENKQLFVDSQKLVWDRGKNIATFTGSVLLCFDSIMIVSQKAIFLFEDSKSTKIKSIIFPEKLRALSRGPNGESVIIADRATYTAKTKELALRDHVIIEDSEGEVIVTDYMTYYGQLKNITLDE